MTKSGKPDLVRPLRGLGRDDGSVIRSNRTRPWRKDKQGVWADLSRGHL